MNYYKLYQQNIYKLIKQLNLKYFWLNISDEIFYNGVKGLKPYDYQGANQDPWLKTYNSNKSLLANDVLENGTFTPIFYQKINNKKYVILGKHRLYSLKLYEFINNTTINRQFLFIEIPNEENPIFFKSTTLFYFSNDNPIPQVSIIHLQQDIFNILCDTGDYLTHWLWENKSTPFKPFNDPIAFEKWIQEEN